MSIRVEVRSSNGYPEGMTSSIKTSRGYDFLALLLTKTSVLIGFALVCTAAGCASLDLKDRTQQKADSTKVGSGLNSADANSRTSASDRAAARAEESADGAAEADDSELEQVEVAAEDEESIQEDLGEGFCKDDIYTQFLMRKFTAIRPRLPATTSYSSKKGKRGSSSAKKNEAESLNFARNRLVGPVAPYFGSLPVVANARVEYWIRYFKGEGRKSFLKWLVRGESLQDVVQPLLIAEGLPPELFFLAMVESGFSNLASSRAKATGTWQFMNGTAKLYGLKINYWVDERRDPIKSTIAAARYLRDLYAEFGDWYLAMAAYNAGPGKVKRGINHIGSRDFWALAETNYLRPETKHYVPKVLGALILASDPSIHGFDVTGNPHDLPADGKVTVTRPIKLNDVASKMGLSQKMVARWNPELIHGITPPNLGKKGYELRLSQDSAAKFQEIEASLPQLEVSDVKMHKVERGETLAKIARRYNVRIYQILSINPDIRATALKVGRSIAVPVPSVVEREKARSSHG